MGDQTANWGSKDSKLYFLAHLSLSLDWESYTVHIWRNASTGTDFSGLFSLPILLTAGEADPCMEQPSLSPSSPLHSTNNDHNDTPNLHNTLLKRHSMSLRRNSSPWLKCLCQVALRLQPLNPFGSIREEGTERYRTFYRVTQHPKLKLLASNLSARPTRQTWASGSSAVTLGWGMWGVLAHKTKKSLKPPE